MRPYLVPLDCTVGPDFIIPNGVAARFLLTARTQQRYSCGHSKNEAQLESVCGRGCGSRHFFRGGADGHHRTVDGHSQHSGRKRNDFCPLSVHPR
jgi:hypothetical protein